MTNEEIDELKTSFDDAMNELYHLRNGILEILQKNAGNRNEMYKDLEKLYNGEE